MGLRFRRSFKLAPGLRMNLSRSGLSWSAGPRGASMSFGQRGVASNLGIPGTGLSYRQSHGGAAAAQPAARPTGTKSAIVRVDDDGNVTFVDEATGQELDEAWVALAKKQAADTIKKLVSDQVNKINESIDALGTLHTFSPPPTDPKYQKTVFDLPAPEQPTPRKPGLIGGMFAAKRAEVERENEQAQAAWRAEVRKWEQAKAAHEASEERRRVRVEKLVLFDVDVMEEVLQENIADIAWPRETDVSFELRSDGALGMLDVDLPEIEDMPQFEAVVTGRGFEVKKKELSETKRRKVYMQHIHSIALRLIGEVFATLPRCEKVILSGYSQRTDPKTGRVQDEYLLSLAVDRHHWRGLDFNALAKVDALAAVERFECRRNMTKTGVFTAVEPLA